MSNSPPTLWESVALPDALVSGEFRGRKSRIALAELTQGTTLGAAGLKELGGRAVLLATQEQLPTALALIELDGIARRVVLCTPDLSAEQLGEVAAHAGAEAIVVDGTAPAASLPGLRTCIATAQAMPGTFSRRRSESTEWILLTSGTSGSPKLVVHTLQSLAGALPRQPPAASRSVWSTFYDIRRYGGLQIYLRAVLSGSPLVLSSAGEPTGEFLARAAAAGVTHISGTPSHWRRALMSGEASRIAPEYVRLSGEVADQTVLDSLRAAYPNARIAHAFASTEAGVAFEVNDGLAGFPAQYIDSAKSGIEMKVQDGTLRIRSGRIAARYLGADPNPLSSEDGYVDTGDLVELLDGRYFFRGRKGGVINVGGLKVYPEEVESVLNADPRVRMSLVRGRRNPITGAVVLAEVVLAESNHPPDADMAESVKHDLLEACRRTLPAHKVPAMLRFVPALELTAAGKLVRAGA